MSDCDIPKVQILGVDLHLVTVKDLHGIIERMVLEDAHALVLNANVHLLNLAYQHPWLRQFENSGDIVFCDGAGVIIGARMLGYRIPQRITYADWMWQLAEFAEPRGFSLFFLGARPGVADQAAAALKQRFADLVVLGTKHGYFETAYGGPQNQAIVKAINAVKPDILVVGMGMPRQERWLMENWDDIEANVALPGGAVFDYVSGKLRRPDRWMTEHSLEWLGRLLVEPRRLWRRYFLGNPIFLWRVVKQRLGLVRFE